MIKKIKNFIYFIKEFIDKKLNKFACELYNIDTGDNNEKN